MDRNTPIQELNGVGPKTEKILQKLGVYTVGDILLAFPRDYKQMPEPEHISVAEPEKVYAFQVRLCSSPVTRSTRAMQISTAQFSDGTGKVEAVWFDPRSTAPLATWVSAAVRSATCTVSIAALSA